MISAKLPENENLRLKELDYYQILDTEAEKDYDDIVRLASNICGTKISLVSLVDEKRQWFKAKHGVDAPETPREIAFCAHAIHGNDIFVVEDASKDERFHDNPLVTQDPNIRFYAGIPLKTDNGFNLGTLCVIDDRPKELSIYQMEALETLRNQVIRLLELKRRNYDLQETLSALTEANDIKTKLFSIISHDLKSPIANLDMFLQVIEKGFLSIDDSRTHISALRDSLNSTNSLLSNLFSWANSQIDNATFYKENIDLNKFIDSEFDKVRQIAEAKNIKLINNVEKNLSYEFEKNQLSFILRNLINNSIKYTENGKIEISSNSDNDFFTLKISDTGIGMSKETLNSLFKSTSVDSQAGTKGEKGTGFGLFIVKEFIENHNGKISIESELGKGTSFSLSFPLNKNFN